MSKPSAIPENNKSAKSSRFYKERQGECSICSEPNSNLVNISKNCTHLANSCIPCLTQSITTDIESKGSYTFRCAMPACNVKFEPEEYYHLLDKRLTDITDNLLLHRTLEADEEFRWCKSSKGCGAGQLVSNHKDLLGYYTCHACHQMLCFRHSIEWHTGYSCDEFDKERAQNDDLASDVTVLAYSKKCPNEACGTPIMKLEGCDVMTCCRFGSHACIESKGDCDHGGRNYCGQRFCWSCLDSNTIILGKPLSWSEWDLTAPVSHYLVSFTVDEIKNMWEDASSNSEIRISRLDALLAHIWMLIIRARELSHDQQPIYLDVTLGLRSRLNPPLSENFVGSPIILGNVSTIGIQPIGKMALSIRSTLSKFNSSSIGPMLHELAFELSPNRLWNAFLGRRNTIVTSWLHLKTYEVDFGIGVPRFVNALMPSVDGCVHLLENGNTKGAGKINRNTIILGKPLSWSEWDLTAPVSHYLVSFTVDEIKNMWEDASSNSEIRISRLDALLAHIWMLIIRARELSHDQQPIYLDVTLGLRSRLNPPLSENFVGSPIILGNVSTIGIQPIDKMALSIRSTLSKFNSSSIGPMLHELAFELSPNRLWNAFLGRRNTIVTSWLHLKTYEVDFGIGVPRFVNALMPSVDGCVHLLENGNTKGTEKINRYDEAVSVSLHLRKDVMEKLLVDPELRKYRNNI
ncbi:unnamed protein product [Adineta steineri]|uniref:RING-type domain-containing protein n=3 Tax=Adineta steineri TaxID=433720 RepID=A0A813WHM5_9BILA|nr:unnamed protein product [Adineta steineri]